MRRGEQGFTLIELLVAAAIALLLLGLIVSLLATSLHIQARENQNVPVQQALRASIEVIAQDLRASIGPRVMYADVNGAGNPVPSGLALSTGTSVTILVPQANSTFVVSPPVGYPNVSSLPARSFTVVSPTSLTDTGGTSQSCSAAFTGSDYGVLYSTLNTNFQAGAGRAPDAFRVFQTAALLACPTGGGIAVLNHTPTPLPQLTWNPNTYVVEVIPVRYYVSNSTLYRQLAGQTAQVVAYNISALTLTYLPENPVAGVANCSPPATFVPTPTCTPRSVNVTLTSTPQNAAVQGARTLTASQIVFLR
ncbi:prepilin-type N-terminal cleavage/methylation domain-containing protein (plasmid) [Deinococcus metallilatus]|uniref:Prepilin-type N-terminal cleavage/methylation domain-containing protein n=1 Tax=Deinococcus metallilatus TaxID=1211322 RepID=A0AAJ5K1I3_9DEIO|nr:prepilin-type N-terminal cleavage/methylation domain-containing protein [Deinococcus metallilatus]MBB5293414.1 prepilin-type N-terminal cleavage/methylation domain-containing protein [Deinococcus metallilatus]QBY06508.1 prepilin-type N-terminal cleavage/methylation domain-containing protein [Deinococcus metallilatus]RXJ17851.1 prepilin-type N-terminal cleavage/methylation domain-containing protein [Deinococcus metallilatus]TLK32123.1 prepilin-type N-terminal cleavage/methylation domain-conta